MTVSFPVKPQAAISFEIAHEQYMHAPAGLKGIPHKQYPAVLQRCGTCVLTFLVGIMKWVLLRYPNVFFFNLLMQHNYLHYNTVLCCNNKYYLQWGTNTTKIQIRISLYSTLVYLQYVFYITCMALPLHVD